MDDATGRRSDARGDYDDVLRARDSARTSPRSTRASPRAWRRRRPRFSDAVYARREVGQVDPGVETQGGRGLEAAVDFHQGVAIAGGVILELDHRDTVPADLTEQGRDVAREPLLEGDALAYDADPTAEGILSLPRVGEQGEGFAVAAHGRDTAPDALHVFLHQQRLRILRERPDHLLQLSLVARVADFEIERMGRAEVEAMPAGLDR